MFFHRCGLQLNRVYNRCIIPIKVMTSGQHSAAETPHKFRLLITQARSQGGANGCNCTPPPTGCKVRLAGYEYCSLDYLLQCNLHVHILTRSAMQLSACILCTCACKSTGTIQMQDRKDGYKALCMYHIWRNSSLSSQ